MGKRMERGKIKKGRLGGREERKDRGKEKKGRIGVKKEGKGKGKGKGKDRGRGEGAVSTSDFRTSCCLLHFVSPSQNTSLRLFYLSKAIPFG